ncbi:hypothetical protein [Paenibacillus hunanensis]|uniref:Uncharacterized protein n=1 Tax=Paenibacillus hunanensis TaxID=539262 RepID=A0ABU1IXS9_9BACL|nr:hypothetical protein [Paenibacillus hunanensis]MDR6243177.1 hypothetical protein [Paenibacillus hunanensis]GGJ11266.1 hypothetical protein GCM10008022_20480 [Paenibacillus hunanensis]
MDLNKLVNNAMAEIQESGFVEQVVKKQLESTISSIISDLFRSYGTFGETLKKQIEEQLNIDFGNLNIAGYNQLVLNAVKEKLDEAIHIEGVQKIKEAMDKMLGDPVKEIKLSELVEVMKEEKTGWGNTDHDDEVTVDIDNRSTLSFIGLDEEEGKERFECKYRFSVCEDGSINTMQIDGKEFNNKIIMGGLRGFEKTLFKMYASGTKIIVDEDDVNTYYSDREY